MGFVFRGGFPCRCCLLVAEQDLLDLFFASPKAGLLSATREPSSPGLSGILPVAFPASQQVLLTSAFEPRNFFLAVGDAEPELIPAALGLPVSNRFLFLHPTKQARLLC